MGIQEEDRIVDVLKRDERLRDVLASSAPAFGRLRSPHLWKAMTQVLTVEQAAELGGIHPELLVERLNRAWEGGDGTNVAGGSA